MTDINKKKMDSVSSRQFREFRDFSAIAENHWPYIINVAVVFDSGSTSTKITLPYKARSQDLERGGSFSESAKRRIIVCDLTFPAGGLGAL